MRRNSSNGMVGFVWTWGLMLSVSSLAVVAYRNDLSSSRHGCIWSTIDSHVKETTIRPSGGSGSSLTGSSVSSSRGSNINPFPKGLVPSSSLSSGGSSSGGGVSLNCNLRTLSMDFWNYTFNREQIEQTRLVRVKCSDKLFFESLLSPNQTLFQLQNLREVQIESCKIRKVPRRVWASLTKLKSLVIRTMNTEWSASVGLEIEVGSFEGLGQLEVLDLSQNNIWTFPSESALCPLRSLLQLNVSHNRLSDIEEFTGSGGNASPNTSGAISRDNYCALSVVDMDLSFNSLRRVGNNAFSRMRRLSQVRLQNNLIAELEDFVFGGLDQLRLVNLSSNRLVAIPPSLLKTNSNLQEINFSNNSISALSSQVFSKLGQLLVLDLSRNSLSSQWVKEDIFHGLIRLVVLKLSWNQLSYLDSLIFRDLISIQALHLDNNRIETMHPEAFSALSNLHILDLSNNKLTQIDSKHFTNLFVLRQLYIDHNKIRKMDEDSLKNCTSIQDLGLADNLLQDVPVALRSLGQLKTIDIGENKISQVSNESFSGMSQLYGLRMVDNRLAELPDGFCQPLKKLRVLNLSQNRIQKISPTGFSSCLELRVLRLDSNRLEEFPTKLTPQLLWLNVSENQIQWADYRLLPRTIEWVDLSYNSLESLTGPLTSGNKTVRPTDKPNPGNQSPYHLRVLDVSYNKLRQIDQTAIPSSLETLRVNHNVLETVAPDTFSKSSMIRRVELIGNQIENLPLESLRFPVIPSGRTLPEFYLGNNPFLSHCSMEYLTRVNQLTVLRSYPRIVDVNAIFIRPTFSRSNQVVPLVEARPKDFLCPYQSHCFALCQCCDFEFCDCENTCPQNCTCLHDTSWGSNIVQCSNLDYQSIPKLPMDSTEAYLDGGNMPVLTSHSFIGRKKLRVLYLNSSKIETVSNKSFNGLQALEVLRLEDNQLTELREYTFADLSNLRELYLHSNLIQYISPDTFAKQKFLQVLTLHSNSLIDFNVFNELSGNGYLNSLTLSGNPWTCDCEYLIPFRTWVATKAIVVDFALAKCQMSYDQDDTYSDKELQVVQHMIPISSMCGSASSPDLSLNYDPNANNEIEINNHISALGDAVEKVTSDLFNPPPPSSENHLDFSALETGADDNTFWILIICLSALLLLVLILLLVFRKDIYNWSKNALFNGGLGDLCCGCCPGKSGTRQAKTYCPSGDDEVEKLFDAYFLYSKHDQDLMFQKLIPELEQNVGVPEGPLRLCLHHRDLCLNPDNPWNREMILSACDASKRVVIVLSREFLQLEWNSSSHFRQAIQSAISLHQRKLIFVLLPTFAGERLSSISPELKGSSTVLKKSTLEWTDKNFWPKFRNLLPNPSSSGRILNYGEANSNANYSSNCESTQLPYNLIMNPNLHHHHHNQHLNQSNTLQHHPHHYHQNIIPYQIPMMTRNNSLPPVPKHQIVLPVTPQQQQQLSNWHQSQGQPDPMSLPLPQSNGLLNPHHHHHLSNNYEDQDNHSPLILASNQHSVIHPIPSQLAPQPFGYSNEAFHLQQSNHLPNHHHHNNHPGSRSNNQPIHFSSSSSHLQQNPHHQQQPISVIPPHSHTSSQVSNNFCCYPHIPHHQIPHFSAADEMTNGMMEPNYSSSAVSSANGELDHVYSTLDSPLQSPNSDLVGFCPSGRELGGSGSGGNLNCSRGSQHQTQHSTSSGISSGSDMTSGGDISGSSAVSPSSPIKNGILNKLNGQAHRNSNGNNGKMYFV